MEKYTAVVLAGAPNEGALKEVAGDRYEALIEVAGRPMISYVIGTLRRSPHIGRIGVVGPVEELSKAVGDTVDWLEPSGQALIDNIFRGLERAARDSVAQKGHKILLVTSDIPLLSTEALDDFFQRCQARGGRDVYYPVVPREANEAKYPGVHRTYVRTKEGTFTGGNLVLVAPEALGKIRTLLAAAVNLRKKPWQLSRLLGLRFTLKLLFHRLSVQDVEAWLPRALGITGAAIISPYPEVGIDVDKPSDLALVRQVFAER
ncbi:MAG: nucleotidyltransferase family protein [Firmicutes bacterium]|nr:nucleotidyltransferase family protein [Bacillota bacterium]